MANNIIFSEKKINLNGLKELSRIISGNEKVYEPIINNQWFKEAVQGDPYAQYSLGLRFSRGDEVERNNVEAAKWYRRAAEQGYSEAQVMLGVCFRDGNGVKKNDQESVRWYRRAAEQGYSEAQLKLGLCFMAGEGVKKNNQESLRWFRKAAKQGNEIAIEALEYLDIEIENKTNSK